MEFKEWSCLRERESFTINPKTNFSDAQFYFGRKQLDLRMKNQLKRSFIDPQVPKMMVWGQYGCGKTQTLYYLSYWLDKDKPSSCKNKPHSVHLEIEIQSKSSAVNWHIQNMEALGMQAVQDWLSTLYSNTADFNKSLIEITDDPNIIQAFNHLRGGGDLGFTTWRWLTGQKLTAKELQEIKVTRNLGEVGVGDLVIALQACGKLASFVDNCLIFFIDEMEQLQNIREGDAAESWHQYLRKLSDDENSSVGFIIGFKADTRDDAPKVIFREDVYSRISAHNYIELETLAAPPDVQKFVKEMLAHLVDQEKADKKIKEYKLTASSATYPFTESAYDLLCVYACQDSFKSTPRNIIRTINECAISAWECDKKIIDDEIVNEIAPIIFG